MARRDYASDVTDAEWAILLPLLDRRGKRGPARSVDLREVWNGAVYALREGCRWRSLPHDHPPWGTVWWYFRRWRDDGTLERAHDALRGRVRRAMGKEPAPSLGLLDSQSVRTAEEGGPEATTRASG